MTAPQTIVTEVTQAYSEGVGEDAISAVLSTVKVGDHVIVVDEKGGMEGGIVKRVDSTYHRYLRINSLDTRSIFLFKELA